jgi:hypothetical protein
MYRKIHKSLRDFRPLRYSSRDGHAEGEHKCINRGRDTSSFYPTLQVLDMSSVPATQGKLRGIGCTYTRAPYSTSFYHICDKGSWRQSLLSPGRCCNLCGRNFITGLTSAASPRVDISSTYKLGQKVGVSLPLLTCYPSEWPPRLLYRRARKSRRNLWITM